MKLLTFFLLSPIFLFGQTQIGYDIDGVVAGDHAGHSVSISNNGSIVAIGSPDFGNEKGQVRIFENSSDNWIQIGEAIEGEDEGDQFGSSVSLSGDGTIIAIGAPYNDNAESDAGNGRVFENISGIWTQIGGDINGDVVENRFGLFVSLSDDGSKLAIAGYWCCGLQHGNPGVGKTRIYENSDGNWILIGDEISTTYKGIANIKLSVDGSVIAIANPGGGSWASSGSFSGGVSVFRNESGVWTQLGETFYWENSGFDFIYDISLFNNGYKIVIDGYGYWNGEGNITKAFEYNEENWVQLDRDLLDVNSYNKISISDNGNVMAVGGSVTRVYEYNSGNWTQLGIDINEEASDDTFGASLELSGDGSTLIVGAPNNDGNGEDAGHARVYDLSALLSSNEFILTQFNLYPNPASNQFEIKLNSELELQSVNIYNNLGQFLQMTKTNTVQTSNFASGLYYVEVITNRGKATKKLVIN